MIAAAVGLPATAVSLGGETSERPAVIGGSTLAAAAGQHVDLVAHVAHVQEVGEVVVPQGLLDPLVDMPQLIDAAPRLETAPSGADEVAPDHPPSADDTASDDPSPFEAPGVVEVPDPYEPNGPGTVVEASIPDPPSIEASMADGLTAEQIEEYRDLASEYAVAWEVLAIVDILVSEKEDELTALAQEEAEREATERARAAELARQGSAELDSGNDQRWSMPLAVGSYRISARFGAAGRLWSSGRHTGQDFAAAAGTPISAVRGGTVRVAGRGAKSGWAGLYVELVHPEGWTSVYAHASRVAELSPGDEVAAGEVIGWVGSTGNSTGPHLHLEIHKDGQPVDPMSALAGAAAPLEPVPDMAPEPEPVEPVTVEPVRLGVELDEVAASLDEMLPQKRRLMEDDSGYLDAIAAAVSELDADDVLGMAQRWRSGRDRDGNTIVEDAE